MHRLILLPLVAATLFASPAMAQKGEKKTRPSHDLIRLEDGWAAAMVKRDTSYFNRTLGDEFVYTEDAQLMSRSDVISGLTAPNDTVTAAHNEDMVVHSYGPVTSVVTGILHVEGRSSGKPYVHRYRFTDTWVKSSKGNWHIVAAQDYLMPKSSK